jgi:hypothetical protein
LPVYFVSEKPILAEILLQKPRRKERNFSAIQLDKMWDGKETTGGQSFSFAMSPGFV